MILNVPAPPSSRQVARCPLPLLSLIGSLSTESWQLGPGPAVIVTTASGFANPFAVPVSCGVLPPSRNIIFPGVELETWMYTSSARRAYRALFARNPRYGSTIMLGSDAVAPDARVYG